jgi:hypothetical protein
VSSPSVRWRKLGDGRGRLLCAASAPSDAPGGVVDGWDARKLQAATSARRASRAGSNGRPTGELNGAQCSQLWQRASGNRSEGALEPGGNEDG